MILIFAILLFCGNAAAADDCQDSGNMKFICGPVNAEDILPLGSTEWLITSGLNGQFSNTDDTGHIYLVNRKKKTFEELFPGENPEFDHDKDLFNTCPGPLNYKNFSVHGLALAQTPSGQFKLYITSHGEREAIEVFKIDTKGNKPAISWKGCVPLPEKMLANSVAILSDGGFVITKFFDPSSPDSFNDIFQGKITGGVYEWHPGGKVNSIPGTDLSGANGIAVSMDNKWVYAAATGTSEIAIYDRTENPVKLKKIKLDIMPDNIRWGDDGLLYTAGDNPPDEGGWSVFNLNPVTMEIKKVISIDGAAAMQRASSAIAIENEIWIGTYAGDRIAYLPKP